MQKCTDLFISCLMHFQIWTRALTCIVHHLEFVKRSVSGKLAVCVTKTALPTKIQCVPVTEQHTATNPCTSWATAGDWTTIQLITLVAVRVSEGPCKISYESVKPNLFLVKVDMPDRRLKRVSRNWKLPDFWIFYLKISTACDFVWAFQVLVELGRVLSEWLL